MQSRPALVLLPILLVGAACSRTHAAPSSDPLAFLQLDNGKRWVADDHTRQSVAAMRAAVQAAAEDASAARTTALGKELQDLGNKLVQGCTMSGPAHDALHGYLGVLLPASQRMTGADADAARLARADVAAVLARFSNYFE